MKISEIELMSPFPYSFRIEGSFVEKLARIGNSVPPPFGGYCSTDPLSVFWPLLNIQVLYGCLGRFMAQASSLSNALKPFISFTL